MIGGKDVSNDSVSKIDFSRPVDIVLLDGGVKKQYVVYVHSFTGLPVLWIETESRIPITSKYDYINAQFTLCEDVITRGPGDVCVF